MRISTVRRLALAATLALGFANAAHAADKEYQRGYNDCMAGRYDQDKHGASYKEGCRAAEDKRAASGCPADVSEADRYKYPACNAQAAKTAEAPKAAVDACKFKASKAWDRNSKDIYLKSTQPSGKHHYILHVASGKHIGKCEVGGDGEIKAFSDWKE